MLLLCYNYNYPWTQFNNQNINGIFVLLDSDNLLK